jgi:hypothetical protein
MKNKIAYIVTLIFIAILIINTIFLKHKITNLQEQSIKIQQTANLEIGRSQTELGNAKETIKKLDNQIQDDIKKQKAIIDSYSILEAKNHATGSGIIQIKPEIQTKEIYITKDGQPIQLKTLPFSFDDFRLHIQGDAITKDFKYKLDQNFEIQLAETTLKNGNHNHYAELYELDSGGKRINKLTITKFQTIDSDLLTTNHLKWFDPHLDLGIAYHVKGGIAGELGISLMSYGKPSLLTWRFIRGSAGLDTNGVYLNFNPALYNIGAPLPLLSNIWLAPGIGYGLENKTYLLSFGLSVII